MLLRSSKEAELHVLYNNAGSIYPAVSETTVQGYDLQFGTNVLGAGRSFSALNIVLT